MDCLASAMILLLLQVLCLSQEGSTTSSIVDTSVTLLTPMPTSTIQTSQSSSFTTPNVVSTSSSAPLVLQTSTAFTSTSTSEVLAITMTSIIFLNQSNPVDSSTSSITLASESSTASLLTPTPTIVQVSQTTTEETMIKPPDSGGLSGGAIAGIVIGSITGFLLLIVLLIFCYFLCCYQRSMDKEKDIGDFDDGFVAANVNVIPPEEEILSLQSFKLTFINEGAQSETDSDSSAVENE